MTHKKYDLMVLDQQDFPIIAVRVIRVDRFTEERRAHYFQQVQGWAKYALVVSPFQMELWDSYTKTPIAMFDTATALAPYSGRWGPAEKLSRIGLETLTQRWLSGIISWTNEDKIPYREEFRKLGILEQLKYGIVHMKPEEL